MLSPWCLLHFIVVAGFALSARASEFDATRVQGIPTAGPNCYFAALTTNDLLKVPAMMMSSDAAALLLLNPELCTTIATPRAGDLGLEEGAQDIWHVFTYLDDNRRFEKASPYSYSLFTFANVPAASATRFVRCRPMQAWVSAALAQLPPRFTELEKSITAVEARIDSRNRSRDRDNEIAGAMKDLNEKFGDPEALIQGELTKRIPSPPKSSIEDAQYYKFVVAHPDVARDQTTFAYLWLAARLQTINYIFANYKYLRPANLLP